jgi:hypothetical protein
MGEVGGWQGKQGVGGWRARGAVRAGKLARMGQTGGAGPVRAARRLHGGPRAEAFKGL